MIIQIIYSLFLGAWRRAFGCDGWGLPILKNRFCLHLIGFLVSFPTLLFCGYHWIQSVLATLCLFGLYWARAHGEFFDYGHHNPPDIKRYEQFCWWKYIKKIIPQDQLYKWSCDFICMAIRYTLPSLLIGIILYNIPFVFSGVLLSCGYGIMWKLYDWGYTRVPTRYGEIIGGIITGLLLTS